MTDLTKTVAPKTDQLNADDFIGTGSRTITITGVREMQSKEQPISIHYEGDNGKPWKPCLGMRRVLIELWGDEAAKNADRFYTGRRVTLYRDPEVKFGGVAMGGIRISHASHINTDKKIALTVSKARRIEFVVRPLQEPQGNKPPSVDYDALKSSVSAAADPASLQTAYDAIKAAWKGLSEPQRKEIQSTYDQAKDRIENPGDPDPAADRFPGDM